ncbi:MAG: histidine triad nucleotide-binding protein [Chloroflexi bacterium]|nr:histidine triad nucleotide-binding protein [Chloroflexota bacterium]
MNECLFCRIVAGAIPSNVVWRDETIVAFRDIEPQAPVHVLVVPTEHIPSTNDLDDGHDGLVGRLLRTAAQIARQEGIAEGGYRLVVNTGPNAQQSVPHLHVHILGGRAFTWPPG